MPRQLIQEGERVPVRLTSRQVELIIEHTFIDTDLEQILVEAPSFGASVEALLTLDDLDDLLGQVAAAARPRSIRLLVDRSEIPDLE